MEAWARQAHGKRAGLHWKDGGSAKECARVWLGASPNLPPEVRALLASHESWNDFTAATMVPELVTRLDQFASGRHHDLVVFGRTAGRRAILCIEAKAGEDFGPRIGNNIDHAIRRTNLPARVNGLAEAVFGRPIYKYDEALKGLRYQLLHGIAGTAIEAARQGASVAAFVVQFFPSSRKTVEDCVLELNEFLAQATGAGSYDLQGSQLVPTRLSGGGSVPAGVEVFVGWVVHEK